MSGPNGGSLVDYVDTYYAMKRNAPTEPERMTAKLLLNSLYGKFFQKVALGAVESFELGSGKLITTDPTLDHDYKAGGLYHPPIAALITGYVRAKIHRMEHEHTSIMTSTDGIFAHGAPEDTLLGKELGKLSAELGTLHIWRERLYIFYPNEPPHLPDCKPDCKEPHPIYALHGFQGKWTDLARVPMTAGNVYHYTAQRMVTLRMSTRSLGGARYRAGEFVSEGRDLQMPGTAPPKP
jgi:hypothetical protein